MYLEIFIIKIFPHYAFMAKRNTTFFPPCGTILKEKWREKSKKKRKGREDGINEN
jgi:hypothetical protein